MALLIAFFLLSILFSFLCSMWEAVLLSVTPAYARIQSQKGTAVGQRLDEFKADIDRPLAAILTLNTIAHTVGAIGVGAQATRIWADSYPYVAAVVTPVLMTLAILILSEIIPKTLGANNWQRLVPFTVVSVRTVMGVLAPLVWLSQGITRFLRRGSKGSVLSRSDFLAMAEIGAQEGVIGEDESQILTNLLRFNTVQAADVMTPRTVIRTAPEEMTIQEFYDRHPDLRFSRIPVYQEGSKDHITGYILKDSLLDELIRERGDEPLATIRRDILVVPRTLPIPGVFERLMADREHIALVVDEFGGTAGIVTMEDVIETLLGMEIVDELDSTEDMQRLARESWKRRARVLGLAEEKRDGETERDGEGGTSRRT